MPHSITYTIVIPIKNESQNIEPLFQEIQKVMSKLQKPWELIYINDGSSDTSSLILHSLIGQHPQVHLIEFDANYGQSAAFWAGFQKAQGEWVITIDGDGQNDPKDIIPLTQLKEEYDLVCGWRKDRQDPWLKKIISKIANRIRSCLCEDNTHDTGCSLKVYRASCLKNLYPFRGMHRFFPALFKLSGYSVIEVPVCHRTRQHGKSHYTFFNRLLGPIFDALGVWWLKKRKMTYKILN